VQTVRFRTVIGVEFPDPNNSTSAQDVALKLKFWELELSDEQVSRLNTMVPDIIVRFYEDEMISSYEYERVLAQIALDAKVIGWDTSGPEWELIPMPEGEAL
jgi:hypothetical protein